MATKTTTAEADQIHITQVEAETLMVPIRGTAPLITHRFSEKAKRQMLDAMQGRKSPKEPKDPRAEYLACFYRFKDSDPEEGPFGMPVIAFKDATIGAARLYSALTMTALRQCLFFRGELGVDGQQLATISGTPREREDVVRVQRGTDLRYRPEFTEWSTVLTVIYVKSMLTRESVVSLIDAGGLTVGVGEWRPEKKGDMGTYEIDPTRTVEVLK